MKNTALRIAAVLIVFMFQTTIKAQTLNLKDTQNTTRLFPKGDKLSNEWFTGNAYLKSLVAKDKNNEFALGSVTFEPGARTIWHTHPKGQVLIVTEAGSNSNRRRRLFTRKKANLHKP